MGRHKINMQLIKNKRVCMSTYMKRKEGLMKKITELTTLCDVNGCVIIYGPTKDGSREEEKSPEIWPANSENVRRMIEVYREKSKDPCVVKRFDLSDYFEEREKKISAEIMKTRKRNMEIKYPSWYDWMDHLPDSKLAVLVHALDDKVEFAKAKVAELKMRSKENNNGFLDQGLFQRGMELEFINQRHNQIEGLFQRGNKDFDFVNNNNQPLQRPVSSSSSSGGGLLQSGINLDFTSQYRERDISCFLGTLPQGLNQTGMMNSELLITQQPQKRPRLISPPSGRPLFDPMHYYSNINNYAFNSNNSDRQDFYYESSPVLPNSMTTSFMGDNPTEFPQTGNGITNKPTDFMHMGNGISNEPTEFMQMGSGTPNKPTEFMRMGNGISNVNNILSSIEPNQLISRDWTYGRGGIEQNGISGSAQPTCYNVSPPANLQPMTGMNELAVDDFVDYLIKKQEMGAPMF